MTTVYSFAVHTLGCKVNQYETELITNQLLGYGFRLVDFSESADVYVINTCTVTKKSDQKSRQWIARAIRRNQDAMIAVTGCYAQRAKTQVEQMDGVGLVIGNESKTKLAEQVCDTLNIKSSSRRSMDIRQHFHTRALIKVQDGCDNFCSFCVVPHVRGAPRSRPLNKILTETSELIFLGVKEIVLTGINLGKYGQDLVPKLGLIDLVKAVQEIQLLARFRLSSIEVNDITAQMIDCISSSGKFCHHLHIPLQSGDDQILQRMNRNYSVEQYLRTIGELKQRMPDLALTTDVMVGFPGETTTQFKKTKVAMEKAAFRKAHVFRYSDREGTKAVSFTGKVSQQTKEARSKELIELSHELSSSYLDAFVGRTLQVLVERVNEEGHGSGITDNYMKVEFPASGQLEGALRSVRIERRDGLDLYGRIVP